MGFNTLIPSIPEYRKKYGKHAGVQQQCEELVEFLWLRAVTQFPAQEQQLLHLGNCPSSSSSLLSWRSSDSANRSLLGDPSSSSSPPSWSVLRWFLIGRPRSFCSSHDFRIASFDTPPIKDANIDSAIPLAQSEADMEPLVTICAVVDIVSLMTNNSPLLFAFILISINLDPSLQYK